jgi:hypothetical protein
MYGDIHSYYIKKEPDGFRVVIKKADGSPAQDIVDSLAYVFGTAVGTLG